VPGAAASKFLSLDTLSEGLPGLSPKRGAHFGEASTVALHLNGFATGSELKVDGDFSDVFSVIWDGTITDQILRAWNDRIELAEDGATGIAFLLILSLTTYTIVERAVRKTGIDYYLGHSGSDLPFNKAARLEISGIFKGTMSEVRSRIKSKLEQTNASDGEMPAYVVVVEFSRPLARVVKKAVAR
jgi:hypothetical protein